jgi:hypothetical protein
MGSRKGEVVLVIRSFCIFVNVDQGFMSGDQSWRFYFAGIGLVRGQDSVGRVRAFGVIQTNHFRMPTFASESFSEACR